MLEGGGGRIYMLTNECHKSGPTKIFFGLHLALEYLRKTNGILPAAHISNMNFSKDGGNSV